MTPARALVTRRSHASITRSLLVGSLFALALGCEGSEPVMDGPLPPPTGKLIEILLYDVGAKLPFGYRANKNTYTRSELPAEFTVLAAMPDSGPGGLWGTDMTYSVAFEVNGQRFTVADVEPYYLTRVGPGMAGAWNAGPGKYEIRTTAYEGKGASGTVMGTAAFRFEIVK